MAAKGYRDKYSAIQRHLDKVLPEQEFVGDTPDLRIIKRIINEDINELSPEVVVSELPRYVWELRKDFESIKQSQLEVGQKSRPQVGSVKPEAELHDKGIFELSDKILSERDFEQLFDFLKRHSFLGSQLTKLLQFLEYFHSEANKFTDWHLNYLCLKLTQNLFELAHFIQINSVGKIDIERVYDRHRRYEDTYNKHNRIKRPVGEEVYFALLKTLLDNAPALPSDNPPLERDEILLVLKRVNGSPCFFQYKEYPEWQRKFDDLTANAQTGYKEYRSAVRETLSL